MAVSQGENEHLFKEVTTGPISSQSILRRLYCDFGDSTYIRDGFLYYFYIVMGFLWPKRPFRAETALERKVFGRFLAAYRRQLCIGDQGSPWQGMISKRHFTYIACALPHHVCVYVLLIMDNSSMAVHCLMVFPSARMSESQLYGVIGTISQWLIPAMEGKDDPWSGTPDD